MIQKRKNKVLWPKRCRWLLGLCSVSHSIPSLCAVVSHPAHCCCHFILVLPSPHHCPLVSSLLPVSQLPLLSLVPVVPPPLLFPSWSWLSRFLHCHHPRHSHHLIVLAMGACHLVPVLLLVFVLVLVFLTCCLLCMFIISCCPCCPAIDNT
jgi:hypothetical protein